MPPFFLAEHVPDAFTEFSAAVRPEPGPVLAEMESIAREEGFPIVGPEVGAWLSQLARLSGSRRVFEFGSGFGYSACWFARALPDDGEIVLTETAAENLDRAVDFLSRMDAAHLARAEVGDAVATGRAADGRIDIAFLDIEKYQYVDAFEAIRENVPVGGLVVADNVMSASREELDDTVDFEVLHRALTDPSVDIDATSLPAETKRHTAGVQAYLRRMRSDPAFETTLLPLGDGVTVSTRCH